MNQLFGFLLLALCVQLHTSAFAFTAELVSTTNFSLYPPAINNGRIVFRAADGTIRLIENNIESVIVSDGDLAPDGGTFLFTHSNRPLDIDASGRVTFVSLTTAGTGLFLYDNGTLSSIADSTTPQPEGTGNFQGYGTSLGIVDGVVAFIGRGPGSLYGAYLGATTGITKIADSDDVDPTNAPALYGGTFLGADIDGNHVVFNARTGLSSHKLFLYEVGTGFIASPLETGDTVPDLPAPCTYNSVDSDPSLSDSALAFYSSISGSCTTQGNQLVGTTFGALRTILQEASSPTQGQSIDGEIIGTYISGSGGRELYVEDQGTLRLIADEAGVTDANGALLQLPTTQSIFGDRGMSGRYLALRGRLDGQVGLILVDLDGGTMPEEENVPLLPPLGLAVLFLSIVAVASLCKSVV